MLGVIRCETNPAVPLSRWFFFARVSAPPVPVGPVDKFTSAVLGGAPPGSEAGAGTSGTCGVGGSKSCPMWCQR